MTENGRGKERKTNGGSATTDQVKDGGGGGLIQKLLKTESTIKKIFYQKSSLPNVALSI